METLYLTIAVIAVVGAAVYFFFKDKKVSLPKLGKKEPESAPAPTPAPEPMPTPETPPTPVTPEVPPAPETPPAPAAPESPESFSPKEEEGFK